MNTRFSFISHAATEAQRKAAFPLDEPIHDVEDTRITDFSPAVFRADKIWSAPEQRAQQTSRLMGLPVSIAEELRDCDYGRWRGLSMDKVQNEEPVGILAWLTDPGASPHGGESIERLISRVGRWLDEQSDVKHAVAMTHPSVIRAAIVYALSLPTQTFWRFDIAPLTVTDLRLNRNTGTLRCVGCPLRTRLIETGMTDV